MQEKNQQIFSFLNHADLGFTIPTIVNMLHMTSGGVKWILKKNGWKSREFADITQDQLCNIVSDALNTFPAMGEYKVFG